MEPTTKRWKREKPKSKKRGICGVSAEEEKEGYGRKDLQKRKVLSLEWKSKGVMDNECGESMELIEEMPREEDWVSQNWSD